MLEQGTAQALMEKMFLLQMEKQPLRDGDLDAKSWSRGPRLQMNGIGRTGLDSTLDELSRSCALVPTEK